MPLELDAEAQEWHERYSTFVRGFRRRVFDGTSFNPTAGGQAGSGVNMTDQGIKMHEKEMMDMKNSMKPYMSATVSNKTQNKSS